MKRIFVALVVGSYPFCGAAVVWAADNDEPAGEQGEVRQGLAKAKISLAQASEAALKEVPGGKVVEAELDVDDDEVAFEVEIASADGKHLTFEVDARSGKVEAGETEDEDDEDEEEDRAVAKAATSLLQAIDAAQEKMPGGRPFAASSELRRGKLVYAIDVLAGDDVTEVRVDAETGKIKPDEDDDDDDELDEVSKAVARSSITLKKAIKAALKRVEDGIALEAWAELDDDDELVFGVRVLTEDKELLDVAVSGKTGKVLVVEEAKKDEE